MTDLADVQEATFGDYSLSENILKDIQEAGYQRPTPVQVACIGPALDGKDIIGLAQTGTGKTAAFALPIIQRLARRTELAALVLAPTRELAAQITDHFNLLGKSSGIRVATIVGGVDMNLDYRALRSWPNVLVATPGRLLDHIYSGSVSLTEIEILVVDEADRMHDMGFIPQVRRILAELPRNRQTMMFTATMPSDVEQVVRENMIDPVEVQIGRRSAPAAGAQQQLFAVRDEDKTPLLLQLLSDHRDGRVLVFVRTKRGVDRLHRSVARKFEAARIHGDREQAQRDEAMEGFRSGRYQVLIATDIAARGLDITGIEHVINYDFPHQAEDYVHRIGRTARLEATGLASSFVTPADRQYLLEVQRLLGDKLPVPETLTGMLAHRRSHGRNRAKGRAGDHGPREPSRPGHRQAHPIAQSGNRQPQQADQPDNRQPQEAARPDNGQPREPGGRRRRRRRRGRGNANVLVGAAQPLAAPEGQAHEPEPAPAPAANRMHAAQDQTPPEIEGDEMNLYDPDLLSGGRAVASVTILGRVAREDGSDASDSDRDERPPHGRRQQQHRRTRRPRADPHGSRVA